MKHQHVKIAVIAIFILAVIALSGGVKPANAGSYTVTYSGGQLVASGKRMPGNSGPPTPATYPYSGGANGSSYGFQITSLYPWASSYNCSGAMVATFTWVPSTNLQSDPPPPFVVVKQWCYAWSQALVFPATLSASTGLTNAYTVNDDQSQWQKQTSTACVVVTNPGASFSLPGVSATVVGTTPSWGEWEGGVQYIASILPVSLQGKSTVPVTGWTPSRPPYLSGTGCVASASAPAVVNYVSHAQLLIAGTVVREYWDTAAPGIPAQLPDYASTGTNQSSVSLNAMFDSTHFGDATPVSISLNVTDMTGLSYQQCSISGTTFNRTVSLENGGHDFDPVSDLAGVVSAGLVNYTAPASKAMVKADILAQLPNWSAFAITTHGDAGVFGDCLYTNPAVDDSHLLFATADPSGA